MHNKKILILEKSKMMRLILKRAMNNIGITDVNEATEISAALDILKTDQPNIICMSYVYYELDNKNIFYDFNLLSPGIKIVLISSTPKSKINPQIFEDYHVEFFHKTSDYEHIANEINLY